MKHVLMILISVYRRFLSPLKPACCRFYPTCSAYALEAVSMYGAAKGGFLAFKRILKCHPFHPGGYDPVPKESNKPEPVPVESGKHRCCRKIHHVCGG